MFLCICTENDQLLLAALVRHLDHKKVEESLRTKTNIIALTAVLARQSKAKATVAEVGAMSDLLRHLQKSLQSGMETSMVVGDNKDFPEQNSALQTAIEECLMEFGRRVSFTCLLLGTCSLYHWSLASPWKLELTSSHTFFIFITCSPQDWNHTPQCHSCMFMVGL